MYATALSEHLDHACGRVGDRARASLVWGPTTGHDRARVRATYICTRARHIMTSKLVDIHVVRRAPLAQRCSRCLCEGVADEHRRRACAVRARGRREGAREGA